LEGGKMGNSTAKAPSSLKQDRKRKANGKVDSANDGSYLRKDASIKKWKRLRISSLT
jgi:hypothetical protein